MNSNRTSRYIYSIIVFGALFVGSTFQNCSSVDFETIDELSKAGIEGTLRVESVDPTELESRPTINVVTILDNSFSMNPILTKTQQAFENMTQKISSFNSEISIFTTTQTAGDKPSTVSSKIYRYSDHEGIVHTVPFIKGIESIPVNVPYKLITQYDISEPYTTSRAPLIYRPAEGTSNFADFTGDFTHSIGQIGVEGSDSEEGLCVLLRSIEKNRNSGTYPVYILATNEDDSSNVSSCLSEYQQNFVRDLASTPVEEQCQPGDTNCLYHYKMEYKRKQQQKINYKYREVSSKRHYTLTKPKVNSRITFYWDEFSAKINYKLKKIRQEVSYEKYIIRDNLRDAKGSRDSFSLPDQVGVCSVEGVKDCSVEEIALIGSTRAPEGIVPGSCKISCENFTQSQSSKTIARWSPGYCSEINETTSQRSCSEGEADLVRGTNDPNHIADCSYKCSHRNNRYRRISTSETPVTCPDVPSSDCSISQKNEAASRYSWLDVDQIKRCNYSCTETEVSGQKAYPTDGAPCQNLDPNKSGVSFGPECSPEEVTQLAVDLGIDVDDISTCQDICTQSIHTNSITVSDIVSCEVGSMDCNSSQLSQAQARSGSRPVTSCSLDCINGPTRSACEQTRSNANACSAGSSNIDSLISSCQISGETPEPSSCDMIQATKMGATLSYNTREVDPTSHSLLKGDDPQAIAQSVTEQLRSAHGDQFYFASFIYPPEDSECQPPSAGLSVGNKFQKIHELLGNENSAVYPNCMEDYSPALEVVFNQIVHSIGRTYQVKLLTDNEWIWSVSLIYKDGHHRKLRPSEFQTNKGQVTIAESVPLEGLLNLDIGIVLPD